MIAIYINNLRRLKEQKGIVIIYILAIIGALSSAIFLSTKVVQSPHIAVVGSSSITEQASHIEQMTLLEEAPLISELMLGKYDLVLTSEGDENYSITSVKSEETTAAIVAQISGENEKRLFSNRGIGTNMLGFLMLFILMVALMTMSLLGDERCGAQMMRIAVSPLPVTTYLMGHSLFTFSLLFVPSAIALCSLKAMGTVAIGYSYLQMVGLIALIGMLASSFALMLYICLSNKDEKAKMLGTAIIILTTVLSGAFYESAQVIKVVHLLPQKVYLNIANSIEQGLPLVNYASDMIYLLGWIFVFCIMAIAKIRKEQGGNC